jgi:hypothetical protein
MAGDNDGFPTFSARLHNILLPEKFKPLGITKYDAKQDPVQWLRCYALSIENAGGINNTKCLYFPFCLDETTRISANGTLNLSTSVLVPGGLPRAIPVSAIPKSIQKGKNSKVEYNIYFITLIRVHLFGTCRVQVHRD